LCGHALEQYTPDKSDWSTFQTKAVDESSNTDHSPDGISWISLDSWVEWDGTVYDPTQYSRSAFADIICPGNTVLGLYKVFYDNNPFSDVTNPTKAEVDNWHAIALNHVRALVGYTSAEYNIIPDKCLHVRALWSDERRYTRMWDTDEYPGTCEGTSNAHCGAGFIPSIEDQQEYLPDGIDYCGSTAGSEGIFSAAKSNIPWSIKWVRPFCSTLRGEGFWGGHTGPWFHRTKFGWSWRDFDPDNSNSNAGLRTKWSGPSGTSLYENPDITGGRFTVKVEGVNPDPRFPGYECEEIQWDSATAADATECYLRVMDDDNCGKRFMTYNSANSGCACYPEDMSTCNVLKRSGRLTWDFEPVSSSFDGLFIDTSKPFSSTSLPFNGRRCPDIKWKLSAGDPSHCLQKIVENDYADCGRNFITWNSANGGCACYPPEQTTCTRAESVRESGRQTFELEIDPSYQEPTPNEPSPSPSLKPSSTPSKTPSSSECPPADQDAKFWTGDKYTNLKGKKKAVKKKCRWLKNKLMKNKKNLVRKMCAITSSFKKASPARTVCTGICNTC